MNENEKRQKRERELVRGVIRALKAAGWEPHSVDDGGDEPEAATTEGAVLEAVFAVDLATAWFRHAGHPRKCCVFFVCGEGDDIIADHSAPEPDPANFAATIDAFMRAKGLY
jgi:hypothetical protein